jgi:hypothetical protein
MAFSERLVADVSREQLLARTRRERRAALDLCRLASGATDLHTLARVLLRGALSGLELTAGSVLQGAGPRQPLRELAVSGYAKDPLNSVVSPGIGSVAMSLLERGEVLLSTDPVGEMLFGHAHPALEGVRSVLALPLGADRLLVVYTDASTRDLDADDVEFTALIASIAMLAVRTLAARA